MCSSLILYCCILYIVYDVYQTFLYVYFMNISCAYVLGDFGSYQLRQFLLNLMSAFTAGLHMMVLVTVAAVPEYKYT